MSTSPEDELITLISRWLAGHIGDDELRAGLRTDGLSAGQAEAVEELRAGLAEPERKRQQLQMVARETLEALALG
jgi:hypothetical protein